MPARDMNAYRTDGASEEDEPEMVVLRNAGEASTDKLSAQRIGAPRTRVDASGGTHGINHQER